MATRFRSGMINGETIKPHEHVIFHHIEGMGYSVRILLSKEQADEIREMWTAARAAGGFIDSKIDIEEDSIRIRSTLRGYMPADWIEVPVETVSSFIKTPNGFQIYTKINKNILEIVDRVHESDTRSILTVGSNANEFMIEILIKRESANYAQMYR